MRCTKVLHKMSFIFTEVLPEIICFEIFAILVLAILAQKYVQGLLQEKI